MPPRCILQDLQGHRASRLVGAGCRLVGVRGADWGECNTARLATVSSASSRPAVQGTLDDPAPRTELTVSGQCCISPSMMLSLLLLLRHYCC
jgi:hypothetical protein